MSSKRIQDKTISDPLFELTQFWPIQPVLKLRLANQNDLNKLLAIGLEIAQESEFLQHFVAQALRLIEYPGHDAPMLMLPQHVFVELLQHRFLVRRPGGDAQVIEDRT